MPAAPAPLSSSPQPRGSGRRRSAGDVRPAVREAIGCLPYRIQLAGGWIDQPFISALNPEPPGSMVVVSLEPTVRFMDRAGMATGTRAVARSLWGDRLPNRDPVELVRELYFAENAGVAEPSGSQDMLGLILPGISRLDYDAEFEGGIFPCAVEQTCDAGTAAWLERVLHLIPVAPRPPGYSPLGRRNLDREWILRLSRSGHACYDAIVDQDVAALGVSMTECTRAWDALLPDTLRHPTIPIDLRALVGAYQAEYDGAMFSGCGGGYLIVASEGEVPGSFGITVRTS